MNRIKEGFFSILVPYAIIQILSVCIISPIALGAGWKFQNPTPPIFGLNKIWGTAGNNVFGVGWGGIILHYNGTSWSPMTSGGGAELLGIWGSAGNDVFAVGGLINGIILHFNGVFWAPMNIGSTLSLLNIWGNSGNDVFAVGAGGTILHYDGTTWTPMNSGTTKRLRGIWGSSGSDVFVVGDEGTILHYDGNAWSTMVSGTTQNLNDAWGSSGDDVFVVGANGAILHYDGVSWVTMTSGTTLSLNAIWGISEDDIYAIGGGRIFHYDGISWSPIFLETSMPSSDIWGSSANDIFIVEEWSPAFHYDGENWSPIPLTSGSTQTLNDIWGSSGNDVFSVGLNGTILHYDGIAWSPMISGTTNNLWGIWGSSGSDVFIVGEGGTILHYNGSHWAALTSGITNRLYGIWGSSGSDVFAVGEGGNILHYDGNTWSHMTSGTTQNLNGIWGSSGNDVFAVGINGTILHYDGISWSPMPSYTTQWLWNIWGSSGNDVFAVGWNGTILHYDGISWSPMPLSGWTSLSDIWGSANNDIYAVGPSGIFYYNGTSWIEPYSISFPGSSISLTIKGVWGSSKSNVFAVGMYGTILHYDESPGNFQKTTPSHGVIDQTNNLTLAWWASDGATSYEYCYDTTSDNNCDGSWTSVGTNLSVNLNGLNNGTIYYWQVRARNDFGITEADGGWWTFTTATGLLNGDFESGRDGSWTEYSSNGSPLVLNVSDLGGIIPQSGNWAVRLGSTGEETSTLSQTILIPNNASFLKYYFWIESSETDGTCNSDMATVLLGGSLAHSYPLCYNTNTSGWTVGKIDVSPYRGQTVDVIFQVVNDSAELSSFFLDNLTIEGPTYLRFSSWAYTVYENGGEVLFTVDRVGNTDGEVSVQYATTSGSAIAGSDFVGTSGTLNWGDGDSGSKSFYVSIIDDEIIEGNEQFGLKLSNPLGGAFLIGYGGATVNIIEGDFPAFSKVSPSNDAIWQSTSPTLFWEACIEAESYEYCYDTNNNNSCDGEWINVGSDLGVSLSGLIMGTTYYWQVRARNESGTIDSNNGTWWNFTTLYELYPPGPFNKSTPLNTSANLSTSPTLTWETSSGASSYEYCIDTTNDNTCSLWTNNGTSTSASLSGLANSTTYYWHVRAFNPDGFTYSNGSITAYWSFTTVPNPPAAFNKTDPANGATNQPTSLTLTWNPSSGATGYEYCYDTSNDNACSGWTGNGTSTSVALNRLANNTTYYWHVRAVNTGGTTYSDGSSTTFWSFTTVPNPPVAFNKTSPANRATDQPTSLTLTWGSSTDASSYEYCYDTTNDNVCSTWENNGVSTSLTLSGLTANTTYYWHVRANNAGGTTYADGSSTAYWSFITVPNPPAVFNKISPANGATNQSTSLTLTWGSSTGATSYEYCYDTSNDSICESEKWVSTGMDTSVYLSNLTRETNYYWQIRAIHSEGPIEADGGNWWGFTTSTDIMVPTAITDMAAGITTSKAILRGTVNASNGIATVSFQYGLTPAYGITVTADQSPATGDNNTLVSREITGLLSDTTYHYRVVANNIAGTTIGNDQFFKTLTAPVSSNLTYLPIILNFSW